MAPEDLSRGSWEFAEARRFDVVPIHRVQAGERVRDRERWQFGIDP